MPVVQRIIVGIASVGVVSVALLLIMTACGPARANEASPAGNPLAAAPAALQPSGEIVWGKVPYCNCFGDAMTANVARELEEAGLRVNLQEHSPRDGWLYFAVTFDPAAATRGQIGDAIAAGGGEMLDGPP